MKTCYTYNNTPYDIKDLDEQTQMMAAKTDTGKLLVLKGYPNAREHLNMTRIKASNAKVGTLGIAVNAAVGQKAALAEATGVFGKGSKFNILFALGFETTKWFLSEKPWQDNFSDLFIGLATTTAKFVAAGVVAVVAAGAVVSIGATAGAVILVAVVGTVVIGFVLDTLDNNLGITQSLKDDWNHVEKKIEKSIKTYNKENPVDPNKFHPSGVPSWLLDKQRGEI